MGKDCTHIPLTYHSHIIHITFTHITHIPLTYHSHITHTGVERLHEDEGAGRAGETGKHRPSSRVLKPPHRRYEWDQICISALYCSVLFCTVLFHTILLKNLCLSLTLTLYHRPPPSAAPTRVQMPWVVCQSACSTWLWCALKRYFKVVLYSL